MGKQVHIERFVFDIDDCMKVFHTPDQYTGNDGVVISFSGDSAAGSSVKDCTFKGPADYTLAGDTEDPFSAPTTAIRIQRFEYGTIDADGFVAEGIQVNQMNITANLWDYEAVNAPVFNGSVTKYTNHSTPLLLYKQAYADTKKPRVGLGEDVQVVNVSTIVSPAFSFFSPQTVTLPLSSSPSNRCDYVYAEAALGAFGSLIVLLIIIFIARSAVELHSDTQAKHLENFDLKRQLTEYQNPVYQKAPSIQTIQGQIITQRR